MPSYTHTVLVRAPREIVFDVVADRSGYAEFTALRSVTLVRPGREHPQGPGAIHKLCLFGSVGAREEITESTRPERLVYQVLDGVPVRDHVGVIDLHDNGDDTTTLTYTMRSTPALPLPESLYRPVLRASILSLANPIAAEATRRAGGSSSQLAPVASDSATGGWAVRLTGAARTALALKYLRAFEGATTTNRRAAMWQLALGAGAALIGGRNGRVWAGLGALSDARHFAAAVTAARAGKPRAMRGMALAAFPLVTQVWALASTSRGARRRRQEGTPTS